MSSSLEQCSCFVDKYRSCGHTLERWIHNHIPGDGDGGGSQCPGGFEVVEREIFGRCCSAACCNDPVEASAHFRRRDELENHLPRKLTRKDEKRVKWEASIFRQLIRKVTETGKDKEARQTIEILAC